MTHLEHEMERTTAPAGATKTSAQRAENIREFLAKYGSEANNDLLADMITTVCRLAKDDCGRGELKLLNRALKELRYGFKVFAAYTDIPKVTIFGSARTTEDDPQYLEAMKFAELIEKAGWMVITGAGDGIMRAGHHGAKREASFGVAISLPFEQTANTIIAGTRGSSRSRWCRPARPCPFPSCCATSPAGPIGSTGGRT